MRSPQLVMILLALASPALAAPHLLDPASVQLADYHGAVPVTPAPYAPLAPVAHHATVDLFLLGLGLAAGGLLLGAGGFAVLYGCREGTGCYGDVTTVIGWVLAAPGVIPLTVGLIMMYGASGSNGRVAAPGTSTQGWAFGLSPLRDGALVSAAAHF